VSYNPNRPDRRWEYEMFTEVLTSARYPEKKLFFIIQADDHQPIEKTQDYDSRLIHFIEKAARNLLRRAGDQGWEPVDAIDAKSLWTKGRVRFGEMPNSKDSIDGSRTVELIALNIFCRRRIQMRSNATVELSTESNPALKHLEMDDDFLLV
jgi:hypothetical protein